MTAYETQILLPAVLIVYSARRVWCAAPRSDEGVMMNQMLAARGVIAGSSWGPTSTRTTCTGARFTPPPPSLSNAPTGRSPSMANVAPTGFSTALHQSEYLIEWSSTLLCIMLTC